MTRPLTTGRYLSGWTAALALLAALGAALLIYQTAFAQDYSNRPTDLTAQIVEGGVELEWDAPTWKPESVTGYEVLRRRPDQGENTLKVLAADTGSAETAYTDATATGPGVRYIYRVKALRGEKKTQWSNFVLVELPEEPTAPSGLTAAIVDGGVDLAWDAPAEGAAAVDQYEIERRGTVPGDPVAYLDLTRTGSAATAHSDPSPLEPGATYVYRVRALRGAEASVWSNRGEVAVAGAVPVTDSEPPVAGRQEAVTTLVSNTGQTAGGDVRLNTVADSLAQGFTTGSNPGGYTVSEVGVRFSTIADPATAGSEITATVNVSSGGDPGAVHCQLTDPETFVHVSVNHFSASGCSLDPATAYFVVLERANNTADIIGWALTPSKAEDSGAASGWSIANDRRLDTGQWNKLSVELHQIDVMGAAVVPPPVTTLVSNTGQITDFQGSSNSNFPKAAQQFTTGTSMTGWTLGSIGIVFETIADTSTAGSELTVTLNKKVTVNTGGLNDDIPGDALCTLTDPVSFSASGVNRFYAPSTDPCPTLSAGTDYFVVLARANNNTDEIKYNLTSSDDEDTGGATGWSIGDDSDTFKTSTNSWISVFPPLQIDIRGPALGGDPVPSEFLETLGAAGNDKPRGIWSDGDTMWVADDSDDKIYAYDMATKGRVPSLDIDTLAAAGNTTPAGIWSDGDTMWVLDNGSLGPPLVDGKIFAYKMVDDPATPENEFGARDAGEDFNSLFPPLDPDDSDYPLPAAYIGADIWSNGETLWVSDRYDGRLVAYDLETKARQGGEDFSESYLSNFGITDPRGIWSDGDTMWVTDGVDDKIYAFTLSGKAPVPQRNFNLLSENDDPRGMWSDGSTVWVSDREDGKIYAYALPPVPPEPPPNPVSVHRVTANSAVIAVDLGEVPYDFRPNGSPLSMTIGRGSAITYVSCRTCTARFVLGNMRPETEYTVDVKFNKTSPVGSVTFTTTYAKAGDVRVTDITPTSATATVNLADVYSDHKPGFHYPVHGSYDTPCQKYTYYLRYKRGDDSPFDGWSEPVRLRLCDSAEVPLSGLDPDTVYDLQVYDDPDFPAIPPWVRGQHFEEGTWLEEFGAFTTPADLFSNPDFEAQMTVEIYEGNFGGYGFDPPAPTIGMLEPPSFTIQGTEYMVTDLYTGAGGGVVGILRLRFDPRVFPFDFALRIDGVPYFSKDATLSGTHVLERVYEWNPPLPDWTDGQTVDVKLVAVADICDRSWWVREKLLELTPTYDTCDAVLVEDLAAITELDFNGGAGYIPGPIKEGDFDGLTGLRTLDLGGMGLFWVESAGGQLSRDLSGGLFSDLTNLETLRLNHNSFYPRLADDAFLGLGNLRELDLRGFSKAEHDRCWSSELGAPAPREYPWNPRTVSPFAFAPLTSLETYNWDADFDTSHIAGYDYTPAPYATNNFSHVAAPENMRVRYAQDSPFTPVIDWDAPSGQSGITGYRIERRVNGRSPSCFDDGLGEHIGTTSYTSHSDNPPRPQRNQPPFNVSSVEYYVYAETSGGNVSLPARFSLPSALAVADAEGREGPNAVLRFVVTLYPSSDQRVTVIYTTFGALTATEGADYVPTNGTLTFKPGETTKVVEVPIIDDDHDDDGETLEFLLIRGSASGASVADGSAIGTIRNHDPEAGPAIRGAARVGETLTADTSGIPGDDGTDDAGFGYQWLAGGPAIDGATAASYELTAGEVGKTIQVRASYTDAAGSVVTLTSAATEAVAYADGHPGPPREVRVEAGHREIYVSWQPPADEGTVPVEEYRVRYREEGGADQELHTAGLSRTIDGLTNGVAYIVQVTARNAAGYGAPSAEMSVTPDALPVWSADMRVVEYTSVSIGASSADLFSNVRATRGLQVEQLWSHTADRDLRLEIAEAVPYADELTLRVGGLSLEFPAGSSGEVKFKWEDVDVDWEDGQTVPAAIFPTSALLEPTPNTPATGAPAIGGTALVGETLTADVSGIADEDGLDNAAFAYQWTADDADIEGATNSTYTLADSEEGKAIRVRVSFTDDAGHEEALTSEPTEAVAARPNTPASGQPTITGTAHVGGTLTADTSGIADEDGLDNAAFAYQWTADDADIEGATGPTYQPTDDDVGKTVKVRATFTDDAGHEETLTSEPTGEVAAKPNAPATGAPAINGTAQVGETLTADVSGIADEDGLDAAAFAYQWIRSDGDADTDIEDATGLTYELTEDDAGKTIKVRVSFTDDAGNEENLTSEATAAIAARPNTPATGAPTIGGTAQVGETLTADTSGIADEDGLDNAAFAHQWTADDADIDGAVNSTYTLADSEEGKTVKVRATFTDDAGHEETLTSAATAAVTYAAGPPGAPREVGVQVGDSELQVTWQAPADENRAPVERYRIRYGEEGGSSREVHTALTTHTLGNLTNGVAYMVQVEAENAAGYGPASAEMSATPRAEVTTEPDTPQNLTGKAVYHRRVSLDWDDVFGADSYEVQFYDWDVRALVVLPHRDVTVAFSGSSAVADQLTGTSFWWLQVRAVNAAGVSEWSKMVQILATKESDWETEEANNPATGLPVISGTAQVGETLTADTSGIADEDGLENAVFSYQWIADDADIDGATTPTYEPTDDDVGKSIRVRVSFTDDAGNEENLTSEPTAAVAATPNSPATGQPTITGTAQVGETLTADTSGIADEDGLDNATFSYQWIADGTAIDGAVNSTYTLADDDAGQTLKVRVGFTDDRENEEALTSEPTAAVADKPNTPSTGQPAIGGTAQVGETLTADTSGIADADGLENAAFTYQWTADDADIDGATTPTYEPTDSEEGKAIRVRVSFTDDAGNEESLTSEPTAAVAAKPNTPATGLPAISGTAQVGETLTADTSGIADADGLDNAAFSYQWTADDADIEGATTPTYEPTDDDVGKAIRVRVSFTDAAGNAETLTSEATGVVAAAANSPATGLPTISGTAQVGETLTADTSSIADEDGLSNVSYSYQWMAGGSDIGGAIGSTYTLTASEQGQTVQVRVTFTDDAGNAESLTSEPTAAVAAAPLALTVSLENAATNHNGADEFAFEIRFSEEVKLSYRTLRDHAFTVTGGTILRAQRMDKPSNMSWRVTVRPDGNGDVVIELPATTDCNAQGAICTHDGGKLSNPLSFTVSGPGQ